MTCAIPGASKAHTEAAFAAAYPELADASTAQIRECMAAARGIVIRTRRDQRRIEMMNEWQKNQLPLPVDLWPFQTDPDTE